LRAFEVVETDQFSATSKARIFVALRKLDAEF